MPEDKKIVTVNTEKLEIRILDNGQIEVIGKIHYNSDSEFMFDRNRKSFFIESIKSKAFSQCLLQQKQTPALIFNHDWQIQNKLVSFNYEDTEEYFKFIYVVEPSEYLLSNIDKIKAFSF